jgi:hypothetical protein
MYWPVGVPRIYALNSIANRSTLEADEDQRDPQEETPGNENEGEKIAEASQAPDASVIGLQVSRNGHIFATITRSSLAIWQARVCLSASISTISD